MKEEDALSLVGFEQIYIVRDAAFGSNFTTKLIVAMVAIGFVLWDRRVNRRWDYLWVFVTGTVLWTAVELSLQLRGTRVMPERILAGQELSLPVSALLQGMSEGAFIAVVGIFVGDRILRKSTRTNALLGFGLAFVLLSFLILLQGIRAPQLSDVVASRREILTIGTLALLLVLVLFDGWFWWRRPQFRARSLAMAAAMAVFALFWTAPQMLTGARSVEVNSTEMAGVFEPAPGAITTVTLGFDVVVEIALAYVPFFSIPVLIGLIPARRRTSNADSRGVTR